MENNIMSLSEVPVGAKCEVYSLTSTGNERRRMLDLGLVQGTKVETLQKSPSGNPIAYFIRGAVIALRDIDAVNVKVKYLMS